ncbi:uncharacterized protein LOC127856015 [Dreissena polymorpha]|uniref:Aminotransferase class I/classII large domain-containing protein n=1 Tax=Dreissena polymorpha TaxID=45954 RepID=A0A9D4C6U5_DREPO|nr:uncharacterized protein LOC127856015 [Dreissena polymorpha]KAH3718541.1 hypothetical protein DPMN_061346 [Dreissena polymorpha]
MTANAKADSKDLFQYLALYDENSEDHENFVPFSMGAPGAESLAGCNQLLDKATRILLSDDGEERFTFQYGPCKGYPGFCREMAKFLSSEYGQTVSREDIMVTAGATQGLHLVATVMFNKDTPVFMEDPTYFIAVKILREDFGMNIIPVPTDSEGINAEKLESMLVQHKPTSIAGQKTPFWGMVYTIPTFNNPKGYCMSPERCRTLIRLARKHDVLLFTEDIYNMLHYDDSPVCPPRLMSYDNHMDEDFQGHVLSNCTFSKILAPGLRLGWIEAPPRIMKYLEKSATAWSGGAFNHYTSKVIASALKEGLIAKHLNKLRKEYRERMDIACSSLRKHLPQDVKVDYPKGGFFIWLELPPSVDTMLLLKLAVEKYKINFIFGASTSPTGGCRNCARLSISFCDKKKIEKGIVAFCEALQEMMETSKGQ